MSDTKADIVRQIHEALEKTRAETAEVLKKAIAESFKHGYAEGRRDVIAWLRAQGWDDGPAARRLAERIERGEQ